MNNWDDFCSWLIEDMKLGNLPIEWQVFKPDTPPETRPAEPFDAEIVRIYICKGEPCQVSVIIPNNAIYMNHDMSSKLAYDTVHLIYAALKKNSPMFFIPYSMFENPTR